MRIKIFLLLLSGAMIISCNKENDSSADGLTISDFRTNLTSGMDYTAIVVQFGQPSKDIGSGIHIYVYLLVDGTQIWIGYTDKIHYARHMDSNNQLIAVLI